MPKTAAELAKKVLDNLVNVATEASVEYTKPVDVTKVGEKIIVPDSMTYQQAIEALTQKAHEEEQVISIHEPIDTYPTDGVHALMKVLGERFGWANLVPTPSFFGPRPPKMVSIETSATTRVNVAWSRFEIPKMEGFLQPTLEVHDGLIRFVLSGEIKRKNERVVREIAEATRQKVREESLYRGKSIRLVFPNLDEDHFNPVTHAPRFIDTASVKEEELVLPKDVHAVVDAALWTPLQATEFCRQAGIPLKRGILFEGIPGTGKTLTAAVTSKIAERNNWTFVYLENPAQLTNAIRFAKLYQPAVVFTEDIDRADEGRGDIMEALLNVIDGVEIKGAEVMVVVTTNDVSAIPFELLRPGRLDAIVSYTAPDSEAVQRLVHLYARGTVVEGEDLSRVGDLLKGNIPATIREVVERSKLTAIGRLYREGKMALEDLKLQAVDLELSASSMMAHAKLLAPAVEDERSKPEKAAQLIADAIVNAAAALSVSGKSVVTGDDH